MCSLREHLCTWVLLGEEMKLLYCPSCYDIRKLHLNRLTFCKCGISSGMYIDDLNAVYHGCAIPIGIDNCSFLYATINRPDEGEGETFEAFVIHHECPTVKEYGPNPFKNRKETT